MMLRLKQQPPEGEIKIEELEKNSIPENYKEVVYIIHPSTRDGDRDYKAQAEIQGHLNTKCEGKRVILIAPPDECVYLDTGTQVTDIRSDQEDRKWISRHDMGEDVIATTFMGGNLERCLAVSFEHMQLGTQGNTQEMTRPSSIQCNLPLDAIYTFDNHTATETFKALLEKTENSNEFLAAIALLTTHEPWNYEGKYGEFEILSSYGAYFYDLSINGVYLGRLHSKGVQDFTPPIYHLNITFDDTQKDHDESEEIDPNRLAAKLEHAQEVLRNKYIIEIPPEDDEIR